MPTIDEYDLRTFSHSFITQTRDRTRLSYLLPKNILHLSLLAPSCYATLVLVYTNAAAAATMAVNRPASPAAPPLGLVT